MLSISGKRIGCLIVCGFSTEFQKINPLTQYLKQQGYAVRCISIAGQDTPLYRSNCVGYLNWMHSVEGIFKSFYDSCDMLIVIGFSIGSLLAMHLAGKYPIDALIVINAPAYYSDYKRLIKGWLDSFYDADFTNSYNSLIGSKIISIMMEYKLKKIIYQLKGQIRKIRCPMLIIQGKKDNLVKWSGAYVLYENAPALQKEIQLFPKSSHEICVDCECKLVCIRIQQFIGRIVGNKLIAQSIAGKY